MTFHLELLSRIIESHSMMIYVLYGLTYVCIVWTGTYEGATISTIEIR